MKKEQIIIDQYMNDETSCMILYPIEPNNNPSDAFIVYGDDNLIKIRNRLIKEFPLDRYPLSN